MLLLLAGGMSAQVAQLLNQADIVNYLSTPLWDSSNFIAQNSVIGTLLHAMLGYNNQPTGLQLLFFSMTIIVIGFGMKLNTKIK
jgi:high-affinity iron transporter